jgi:hypothetical protein
LRLVRRRLTDKNTSDEIPFSGRRVRSRSRHVPVARCARLIDETVQANRRKLNSKKNQDLGLATARFGRSKDMTCAKKIFLF